MAERTELTETTQREPVGDAASDARDERVPAADSTEEAVVRGRASETPFVLLGSVAAVIWIVVGLVVAVALLVWWLG